MKYSVFILLFALIFSSCSTDIDLNADYEERAVVYGLLNSQDSVHYIRIQKAFLGEGSALAMAENPDSIYYGEEFNAVLEEIQNGNVVKEYQLTMVDGAAEGLPKEDGAFSSTPNLLYKIDGDLSDEYLYRLRAKNSSTSYEIAAETPLVKDFEVIRPSKALTTLAVNLIATSPFQVQWNSAVHGRMYDVIIRFHYTEWDVTNPQQKDTLFVDWQLARGIVSNTTQGGQSLSAPFRGDDFLFFLRSNIPVEPTKRREVLESKGPLDFFFRVGGEHIYEYIRINRAQSGLTQLTTRANYSNVANGLGVFSSIYTKTVPEIAISKASIDELACGDITSELNFLNSAGSSICP